MSRIQNLLEKLDLSEKEATLYLVALQYGAQSTGVFADKTGMARSTVNYIFQSLTQKGFAKSEKRKNITYYSVIGHEELANIVLNKVAISKKIAADFEQLQPYFESLEETATTEPTVEIYKGIAGLCRTVDLSCEKDQTCIFVSANSNMHPKIMEYILNVYVPKSQSHRNKNKMLITDTEETRKYLKKASNIYDEIVLVNPEKTPFSISSFVVGNKIVHCSYDPQDLTAYVIENPFMAKHMRTIFTALLHAYKNE